MSYNSNQFFLSSDFFLEFSISRASSYSHSAAFAKQFFREKIVFTSSAVFPTGDIIYLHSRISQTYITTNQWGIELAKTLLRHCVTICSQQLYQTSWNLNFPNLDQIKKKRKVCCQAGLKGKVTHCTVPSTWQVHLPTNCPRKKESCSRMSPLLSLVEHCLCPLPNGLGGVGLGSQLFH